MPSGEREPTPITALRWIEARLREGATPDQAWAAVVAFGLTDDPAKAHEAYAAGLVEAAPASSEPADDEDTRLRDGLAAAYERLTAGDPVSAQTVLEAVLAGADVPELEATTAPADALQELLTSDEAVEALCESLWRHPQPLASWNIGWHAASETWGIYELTNKERDEHGRPLPLRAGFGTESEAARAISRARVAAHLEAVAARLSSPNTTGPRT